MATSTKGYFESQPFADLTAPEKESLLEFEALGAESSRGIPVRVGLEFLRGEKEQPLVTFRVGIPMGAIPARRENDRLRVHLKVAARAAALGREQRPMLAVQTIEMVLRPAALEKGLTDPIALLSFPGRMELPSGKYEWKVVVRDEHTGKVGSYQSVIEVPDFRAHCHRVRSC